MPANATRKMLINSQLLQTCSKQSPSVDIEIGKIFSILQRMTDDMTYLVI